jgi:hypothetical protein
MVYRVASTSVMEWPNLSSMDEVTSGAFAIEPTPPWSRGYVRVVSWNIERGLQYSVILDFLQAAEADVILLQEVDLNVRRTLHRDVASELARSLRLNYVFGKEFQELTMNDARAQKRRQHITGWRRFHRGRFRRDGSSVFSASQIFGSPVGMYRRPKSSNDGSEGESPWFPKR